MPNDLALAPFVERHPPREDVQPAADETIARYAGVLPDALLDLWRRHGFGHYGERQLELIDPGLWHMLDRWIVSPPSETVRVPFMLTPFGILIYYRRLSATDEDVALIDPFEGCATDVVSFSIERYFNDMLTDPSGLEAMVLEGWARVALEQNGPLAPGQIYEIDRMLLSMEMLKIDGPHDALAGHRRVRDGVDAAPGR